MASNIDTTKPVAGTPTTASVRANFASAKDEIEALQNAYAEGTFTATVGNCTTAPTITLSYVKIGKQVTISIPTPIANLTKNSTQGTITLTGLPTQMTPATSKVSTANAIINAIAGIVYIDIRPTNSIHYYQGSIGASIAANTTTNTIQPGIITYLL